MSKLQIMLGIYLSSIFRTMNEDIVVLQTKTRNKIYSVGTLYYFPQRGPLSYEKI